MDDKEIGGFTPRTDITVLPPDDPNKIKLGYKCIEVPPGKAIRELCKEVFSPEEFAEMEDFMIEAGKWEDENE